eukprot:jgi/Ulvmu1/10425/UM062_0021.1
MVPEHTVPSRSCAMLYASTPDVALTKWTRAPAFTDLEVKGENGVLPGSLRMYYDKLVALNDVICGDTKDEAKPLVSRFATISLEREDFQRCKPGAWVGDKIINMMAALVQERNLRQAISGHDVERCLVVSSHFVPKLMETCHDDLEFGVNYNGVRRWHMYNKNAPESWGPHFYHTYGSLSQLARILVPLNQDHHWALMEAKLNWQIEKPTMRLVDSLGSMGDYAKRAASAIIKWIQLEWKRQQSELQSPSPLPEFLQEDRWTIELCPPGSPKQTNGHDCGVFCMMAMRRISVAKPLHYDQPSVTNVFRALCTLECATLQLCDE